MAVMQGPTGNRYDVTEAVKLVYAAQAPLRGFYRIEPVVVMPGKSNREANGNRPKALDADVAFTASAIKWRPDKGAKRSHNDKAAPTRPLGADSGIAARCSA
jgi:hypothetical protein